MPDRNKKYCLLTNDVETHSIWFNTLRDETGEKVRDEGMPILLDIYKKVRREEYVLLCGRHGG